MSAKCSPKQNLGVGREEGETNSQGSEDGRLLRGECFPRAAINNTDVLKSLPLQTIWSPVILEQVSNMLSWEYCKVHPGESLPEANPAWI